MPKPLKPYKVDTVQTANGRAHADVMFDRDTKKFYVLILPGVPSSRVEGDVLRDVKREARDALEKAQVYNWEPMIEIDSQRDPFYRESALVALSFRRFERAAHPSYNSKWVERPHELDSVEDSESRARGMDLRLYSGRDAIGPATPKENSALLPYDQEIWDALVAIRASLVDAREKLDALVRRPDLGAVLRLGGANVLKALPAPSKPAKRH